MASTAAFRLSSGHIGGWTDFADLLPGIAVVGSGVVAGHWTLVSPFGSTPVHPGIGPSRIGRTDRPQVADWAGVFAHPVEAALPKPPLG